jgi:hypothetical protein
MIIQSCDELEIEYLSLSSTEPKHIILTSFDRSDIKNNLHLTKDNLYSSDYVITLLLKDEVIKITSRNQKIIGYVFEQITKNEDFVLEDYKEEHPEKFV